MKSFNVADIDNTRLYVKNHCGAFIGEVLERRGWSYTGKKEAKFNETIYNDSVKD